MVSLVNIHSTTIIIIPAYAVHCDIRWLFRTGLIFNTRSNLSQKRNHCMLRLWPLLNFSRWLYLHGLQQTFFWLFCSMALPFTMTRFKLCFTVSYCACASTTMQLVSTEVNRRRWSCFSETVGSLWGELFFFFLSLRDRAETQHHLVSSHMDYILVNTDNALCFLTL